MDTGIAPSTVAVPSARVPALAASSSLLAALSLANAIGFLPSTVMPIWVGHLRTPPHWPAWYGGATASLQLASLTLGNLTARLTVGGFSPRRLAPLAAWLVGAGFLLMGASMPMVVLGGALVSGVACGWLLESANSIAGCLERAQQTFALLQIVLVGLGIVLFFSLPRLLATYGISSVFVTLAVVAGAASLLFRHLPSQPAFASAVNAPAREPRSPSLRPLALLCALAVVIACQTALMACILEAGQRVGLDIPTTGTVLSGAAALCLLAPVAARGLGERLGIRPPLTAGVLALAASAALLMRVSTTVVFSALTAALMGLPVFVLPYVLALLARFGEAGRWSAVGPGFMMAGAALGPAIAEILRVHLTLATLSIAMALPIAAAAGIFALVGPRVIPPQ